MVSESLQKQGISIIYNKDMRLFYMHIADHVTVLTQDEMDYLHMVICNEIEKVKMIAEEQHATHYKRNRDCLLCEDAVLETV
jgi:hypothetical protein